MLNGKLKLNTPYGREKNKMKMMDCVEVMVEKDSYAKEGVHKGMQGVVWKKEPKDGWLGRPLSSMWRIRKILQTSTWKEEDRKLIPVMSPDVNEQIKAQFQKEADQTKSFAEKLDHSF